MTIPKSKLAGLSALILGAIVAVSLFLAGAHVTQAGITFTAPTLWNQHVEQSFFFATTTNATSTNSVYTPDRTVRLDGADRALFLFTRGDRKGTGNSGSTNFSVQTSLDGITWYNYNTLEQNLATSTVTTVASSITLTGTSSVAVYLKYVGAWHFARCIAVRTTDGDADCQAAVDY